ncbi:hypothetical protein L7F22_068348, partial [Adiantum nelumboides]|nr:hypothetical protein [Adiantum nelumboides]
MRWGSTLQWRPWRCLWARLTRKEEEAREVEAVEANMKGYDVEDGFGVGVELRHHQCYSFNGLLSALTRGS